VPDQQTKGPQRRHEPIRFYCVWVEQPDPDVIIESGARVLRMFLERRLREAAAQVADQAKQPG